METHVNNLSKSLEVINKIEGKLTDSTKHEYFVSLVIRMNAESKDQICEKLSDMLNESGNDSHGFEYIAWRVDGEEEYEHYSFHHQSRAQYRKCSEGSH